MDVVDKELTAACIVENDPLDFATCTQPVGVVVRLAASTAVAPTRRRMIDFIFLLVTTMTRTCSIMLGVE